MSLIEVHHTDGWPVLSLRNVIIQLMQFNNQFAHQMDKLHSDNKFLLFA